MSAVARAQIVVRRPPAEVLAAFVEPEVITQFWLAATTGPLVVGTTVHWSFMVEGAEVDTEVVAYDEGERLLLRWIEDGTTVDLRATPFPGGGTVLSVENAGFDGDAETVVATAIEATQGFTLVLCDLKLLLESGTSPGLVRDKAALITAQAT